MKIDRKRIYIADLYKCSYFQEEPIFFAGKTYTGNYNIDGEFVNKVLVVKFGAEYALVSDIKNVLSYISMQGKVTKDELDYNYIIPDPLDKTVAKNISACIIDHVRNLTTEFNKRPL